MPAEVRPLRTATHTVWHLPAGRAIGVWLMDDGRRWEIAHVGPGDYLPDGIYQERDEAEVIAAALHVLVSAVVA